MIPGGIGSFDLIVISGLTSMGVSNALAVSLLLLFRLTYYIIPFLLGVVFFFKHMGGHINDKYLNPTSTKPAKPDKLLMVLTAQLVSSI